MNIDVNGKRVFAATGGVEPNSDAPDPEKLQPSMVLVHGAGMDSSVWALQTRYLAHRAKAAGLGPVLAIDLPGHGRSEGPPAESIDDYAQWLADVLAHLGEGGTPPVVVGHSMGTFIALELASSHPESVNSIVLVSTASTMPVHPDLLTAATDDLVLAGGLMTGWGLASSTKIAPHPSPGLTMVAGTQALVERSAPTVLATDFSACAAYDPIAAAPNIRCDVTVVSGRYDKMTPARAAGPLIDAFDPTVALEQHLFDCGHMTMTEAAAELRAVLLDVLIPAAG